MDKKEPLISVIVPVYNVEKYLPKCLDSLLAQTWQNLEIIVVDDGSPDDSWRIMQEYAGRDSRIRLHRQKNGGLSAARNAGVELAQGEWIGLLDSDDYVAPEMYEALYRAAEEQDAQMAVCSLVYVTPEGELLPKNSPITKDETLPREQAIECLSRPKSWYYITAPNKLYHRSLFERVRFPVGKLHEDEFTAHLFYWQCERVVFLKAGYYYYVQRESSIMHEESFRKRSDGIEAALCRAGFGKEHTLYPLAFSACNGALGQLVQLKEPASEAEQQRAAELKKKAQQIIGWLLAVPGHPAEKAKILLYRILPRLYHRVLRMKNRLC